MKAMTGILAVLLSAGDDPWIVDFRCAPPGWQTSICLPDDGQKTLVARDGGLLYDYGQGGRIDGFRLKISADLDGGTEWVRQELASPRVPIVRTLKRAGTLEIEEEAFALTSFPAAGPAAPAPRPVLERLDAKKGQTDWAAPKGNCDPAFRNAAIGFNEPIRYRFRAGAGKACTVVFGLCEGWWDKPGQRPLDLKIEGKTRQTVDLVAEKGRNVPALFPFEAKDEDGDGWIEIAVAAAPGAPDQNTILNVLWIFEGKDSPPVGELKAGRSAWPPLVHLDCGAGSEEAAGPPRYDLLVVSCKNPGPAEVRWAPRLVIQGPPSVTVSEDQRQVAIGPATRLHCAAKIDRVETEGNRTLLHFAESKLPPGGRGQVVVGVARAREVAGADPCGAAAKSHRDAAEKYWKEAKLPYGRIEVPDPGIQALLDSSIRNIFQAREIKNGLPAFQVGPTCYRGLWVVDGSFILESMTYVGLADEVRSGIKYLLGFQRPDGSFMLIDKHWKETGIVLWAVSRHARLTGDKAWLEEVWPKVEKGFTAIRAMRAMPPADAPNAGLIPNGFADGGISGPFAEYTNVYWTMVGLRAAADAARWLGKDAQAAEWRKEYEDFLAAFRKAADRDARDDGKGNRYVPIRMDGKDLPQRAQWAFMHAVFPGQVFAADDPIVRGNMAMLRATEQQDMVYGTGWMKDGIWNYFGSFYAHAWLWLGDGEKAARTLYAFANHASPLLVWREEQALVGKGRGQVGDMPHNWASAEFIRLARHLLALERGDELHLFEGLPAAWVKPGMTTRLRDVATSFGPISLELAVAADGKEARLKLSPPARNPAAKVVLHLGGWSAEKGTAELSAKEPSERRIPLK